MRKRIFICLFILVMFLSMGLNVFSCSRNIECEKPYKCENTCKVPCETVPTEIPTATTTESTATPFISPTATVIVPTATVPNAISKRVNMPTLPKTGEGDGYITWSIGLLVSFIGVIAFIKKY